MRVQRTRSSSPSAPGSPLTRKPLGRTAAVLGFGLVLLTACASTGTHAAGVLAYQAADGEWHDDVSRVVAPVITRRVEPVWPVELRTSANQGTVVMRLLVNRQGVVEDLVVIDSVNPEMDKQAAVAAHHWGYHPQRWMVSRSRCGSGST
jgi:TonB family protein